jgi:hypothetical protein
MLDISSYTFCATVSRDDAGIKIYIKIIATIPKAKAIEIPENIINRVTTANKIPIVKTDMTSGLI